MWWTNWGGFVGESCEATTTKVLKEGRVHQQCKFCSVFSKWTNLDSYFTFLIVYSRLLKVKPLCLCIWVSNIGALLHSCVRAHLLCVYDYGALSGPGPDWRVPGSPRILLELSQMACRTPTRFWTGFAARTALARRARRMGTWHVTVSQDKGATFRGHLSVLGPAVLSPNWEFVSSKDLMRWRKHVNLQDV